MCPALKADAKRYATFWSNRTNIAQKSNNFCISPQKIFLQNDIVELSLFVSPANFWNRMTSGFRKPLNEQTSRVNIFIKKHTNTSDIPWQEKRLPKGRFICSADIFPKLSARLATQMSLAAAR